jgi:hypothetical protein
MKAALIALCLASPAAAQDFVSAEGATLRFLDRLTSWAGDVDLARGQTAQFGNLEVLLDDCRYPADNPSSDAEAHLTIVETTSEITLFSGWMLASSPALSALDHPRYDVWVLGCVLPESAEGDESEATSEGEGE